VEIRVSGARLLEDSQIMEEKSVIVDMEKREAIEFDPKATEKIAARFPLNDAPIPYIQGRAGLAAYDPEWPPPKIAGTEKVAKQKCTVLHYGKPEEDGIAACVSKEGVVLRAKIKFPNYEREFEALDFDAGKQDEKWFRPPEASGRRKCRAGGRGTAGDRSVRGVPTRRRAPAPTVARRVGGASSP
jgi:hypothetical protein